MDNFLLYLLKVSAGTSMLYLVYLLLFRKDTFYRRNRILLILTIFLPLLFPLLKIPVISNAPPPAEQLNAIESAFYFENSVGSTVAMTVDTFDYNKLFIWIYIVFASMMMLRIIVSLVSTFSIIKRGTVKSNKFPRIIISDNQIPPFSFFPFAVIPAEEYKSGNYDDILDHEFAHIRQGHTFDLLLSELSIAFQWFNPFVWFLKRSVILNHEYLADNVSIKNKSLKEYQYRLLNFQPGLKNISLAHSFNSLIKNRIIMINKKPTPRMATLKNIMILPVVAFVVYAFATPEYHYSEANVSDSPLTIYETPAIVQKDVKGIVMDEAGKPIENVSIVTTGTMGNAFGALTGKDGKFSFQGLRDDASITFTCNGYNRLAVRADFSKEMVVKMIKEAVTGGSKNDPNRAANVFQGQTQLVVIDGVITDKNINDARKDLGYNMGIGKMLSAKDGTEKYGEKGAKGVYEITTRKKALEMGLKPPFPRLEQQDYPTFQGQRYGHFNQWVLDNAKYPAEAKEKGIEGWVSVNFTIELDGSLSNIVASPGVVDAILVDEILRIVKSAPKWEGPENKNVDEPFKLGITAQFKLPDQILNTAPFVVVEEMPMYPGGDKELLDFIAKNVKYPEAAVKDKIEGKVIIRFAVNPEGTVEAISILKGVNPLLDKEAIRVVKLLNGFKPGRQGGKDVYVWYMVPVTFSLEKKEALFSETKQTELLKFIGENTGYPQEAKAASDTGRVFVVVKLTKGGVIKDCKAYTEKSEIKAPFIPEVVIVGYKSTTGVTDIRPAISNVKPSVSGLTSLKNEALRVANTLSVNEIPDWKDKDMEFALTIIYTLK